MRALREVTANPADDVGPFTSLLDNKTWQHLGITGEEFRSLWFTGAYDADSRPVVRALDRLMRTGHWLLVE